MAWSATSCWQDLSIDNLRVGMRFRSGLVALVGCLLGTLAVAQDQYLLRPATEGALPTVVQKYGLTVVEPVDSAGQVVLVTGPANVQPQELETEVGDDSNVTSFEPDQPTTLPEVSQST